MGDSQVVQAERERLVTAIAEEIALVLVQSAILTTAPKAGELAVVRIAADAALRVIERPSDSDREVLNPCTCGQNGYPVNAPFSNHPHFPGCPHFDKAIYDEYCRQFGERGIRHNHMTRDIKTLGLCPACDLYHVQHPSTKEQS